MTGARVRRTRPRYGRVALLATAVLTTLVAVLGGLGVLPSQVDDPAEAAPATVAAVDTAARTGAGPLAEPEAQDDVLPSGSGSGRRVVFDQSRQRVWLVTARGSVASTYLVSGSVTDNLRPGRYEVFSRSARARGIEDSGTMRLFVRFTRGPSGAAIGFHTIPVDDGRPVQTVADLGTAQSHGCIRQRYADAERMWGFATLGTRVVVVA